MKTINDHFYKLVSGILVILLTVVGYYTASTFNAAKNSIEKFGESVDKLEETVIRLDEHFDNHIQQSEKDISELKTNRGLDRQKIQNNILNIARNHDMISRNREDINELKKR